jgi:hypothetical protein
VALVADELLNPEPGGLDVLPTLEREGWGAIQLPPRWYPDEVAAPLLEQVADHVNELSNHGYRVIVVGERPGLDAALAGGAAPHAVLPGSIDELEEFLREELP